jgi:hypothetical protein
VDGPSEPDAGAHQPDRAPICEVEPGIELDAAIHEPDRKSI